MLFSIQSISFTAAIIFLVLSVYYSYRRRRSRSEQEQGLASAKMNIFMGLMLLTFGGTLLFSPSNTWVHYTVGITFLLLGLLNFFAGNRNRKHFKI